MGQFEVFCLVTSTNDVLFVARLTPDCAAAWIDKPFNRVVEGSNLLRLPQAAYRAEESSAINGCEFQQRRMAHHQARRKTSDQIRDRAGDSYECKSCELRPHRSSHAPQVYSLPPVCTATTNLRIVPSFDLASGRTPAPILSNDWMLACEPCIKSRVGG